MTGHFEQLDEPQKRGQATEALLKSEFVVRGIPVLVPEYDNEPYDLVVEVDGLFYKIQAKTAYPDSGGDTVYFETVSTRSRSDGCVRSGYEGEIDLFGVHNPELSPPRFQSTKRPTARCRYGTSSPRTTRRRASTGIRSIC
jgi:hypothetical protein